MISGPIPANEELRFNALKEYSILDTVEEQEYDDITLLASHICGTPISLISLIDDKRQWFKSHRGLDATETPREYAFCGHAINQSDPFIIQDSRTDNRFFDNPLVTNDPHVIFYAGVPLVNSEGFSLGTLCVIDNKPHTISEEQISALKSLSNQVIRLFELRKNKMQLELLNLQLGEQKNSLKHFAQVAAHDIKSPLNSIIMISNMLEEHLGNESTKAKKFANMIGESSKKLSSLIDGILDHSKNSSLLIQNKENVIIKNELKEVLDLVSSNEPITYSIPDSSISVFTNKTALQQVLLNIISNSIKYNDKEIVKIDFTIRETNLEIEIGIFDNGPGIDKKYHDSIFTIFEKLDAQDKYGVSGNGIGLATVKRLVEGLGGTIRLHSEVGKGLDFIFTIKK